MATPLEQKTNQKPVQFIVQRQDGPDGKAYDEAFEVLLMMKYDIIVDLPRTRFYFQPNNQILILRKANHTNKKYKCPYTNDLFVSNDE